MGPDDAFDALMARLRAGDEDASALVALGCIGVGRARRKTARR